MILYYFDSYFSLEHITLYYVGSDERAERGEWLYGGCICVCEVPAAQDVQATPRPLVRADRPSLCIRLYLCWQHAAVLCERVNVQS